MFYILSLMNKSKVFYKTNCGCILTRNQLINGDCTQNYRLVCPQHKEFIQTKFGYCQECGVKIEYTNPKLAVAKKCVICNPGLTRRKRHRHKKLQEKIALQPKADVMQVLMDRYNCSYRPLCSEMYIDSQTLPCYLCEDYDAADPMAELSYNINLAEIDACIQDKDTTVQTEGLIVWGKFFKKRQKVLEKKFAKS